MTIRIINPTRWLHAFHINHGVGVSGGERVLFLSGPTASGADGAPLNVGDIAAQFRCAWNCWARSPRTAATRSARCSA